MKRVEAILAAAMALSLAGCILGAKPKVVRSLPPAPQPAAAAAAPPPQPLSIPQTQVELPPVQPLNPEAVVEPPPFTPAETPTAPRPPRRPAGPVVRTEPSAQPVAQQPQQVEERPPIQEILAPADQKRLQDLAEDHKRQIRQLIAQARSKRRLSGEETNLVKRINQVISLSDEAQKTGDMRGAEDLAQRALVLAQGLQRDR